eukprot:948659-Amphidinium_carterae.1
MAIPSAREFSMTGGTSSGNLVTFCRLVGLGPLCGPFDPRGGGGAGFTPPPTSFAGALPWCLLLTMISSKDISRLRMPSGEMTSHPLYLDVAYRRTNASFDPPVPSGASLSPQSSNGSAKCGSGRVVGLFLRITSTYP